MNATLKFILCALALSLAATGCRTVRGFGQDVESAGHHIERAASR